MLDRILRPLTDRFGWARTALAVQKRFGELKGGYLASAVTLNLFLSIFPLLLVAVAIVGFVTNKDQTVAQEIIRSLGLKGANAETMQGVINGAANGKKTASILGFVGSLWSGLGVAAAIEYALDRTWQFSGRSIKDKLRALLWGGGTLVILGASIALTAAAKAIFDSFLLGGLAALLALGINFTFWMWTFMVLSLERVKWRAYVPGAAMAAIGIEVIKQVTTLLPSLVAGSPAVYQSLSVAFALLASLLLFGRLLVYASLLNVVRWEEDHGTVTLDIEVPRVPGAVPTEADRGGATEPNGAAG